MYKWIKRKRTKNQTNIFRFSFSSSSSERKKEQHVGEKSEKVLLQQENYNYFLSGFFFVFLFDAALYISFVWIGHGMQIVAIAKKVRLNGSETEKAK